MDTETRQSLGLALIGAVALVIGLVLQLAEGDTAKGIGGIGLWGGGICLLIGVLRIAFGLIRKPESD